jgi:hypothetical protein
MKKSIEKKSKTPSSAGDKKNTRSFTAKQKGYKENVFNNEEQNAYEKSNIAKSNKKNTAGPKS